MFEDFDYLRPGNLDEAVAVLAERGCACRLLAGGTALLVDLRAGHRCPELLIDISDLPALRFMVAERQVVRIGAATTLTEIAESPMVNKSSPMLAMAATSVGGPQIRNKGTIGGNLVYASPGADMAPALLALEAVVKLKSLSGEREVPVAEFFVGPRSTVCRPDEIITEVGFPLDPPSRGTFIKLGLRSAMAVSVASVAVWVKTQPSNGAITEARVALGAIAPTPIRAKAVEESLRGRVPDEEVIKKAATLASGYVHERQYFRASGEYRRRVVSVLVQRALEETVATPASKEGSQK